SALEIRHMEIVTLSLSLVAVVVLLFVYRQMQQVKTDMQSQMHQLQQDFTARLESNTQTLSSTLSSNLGLINSQVSNTTNAITQVQGNLGRMQESTRQIMDLARDIKSLQNILQSPKMRGGLGEFLLEDLLSQCLQAGSYRIQHSFGRGTIV